MLILLLILPHGSKQASNVSCQVSVSAEATKMPAHPHDRNRACGWLLNSRAHFPLQEMLAFLYASHIRYERSRVLGETLDDRSNITAEDSVKAISPYMIVTAREG